MMNDRKHIHVTIKLPDGSKTFLIPATLMTLLDAIHYIQKKMDPTISIRWNCRSGQCGICAVEVNGRPKLACQEKVRPNTRYIVKPICMERHIQGLICDVSDIYKQYFLTNRFYWQTELQRKKEFEELLLDRSLQNNDQEIPHVYPEDLNSLRKSLVQTTKYPWFEECFQGNTQGYMSLTYPQSETLLRNGLIEPTGKVRFRINILRDCIFITDGPWNIHRGGVFPFEDESELILGYIKEHEIDKITYGIIDPACGCGHTGIAYWGIGPRIAFDINPRAGYFVSVNAIINQREVQFAANNIFDGLPRASDEVIKRKPLFAINIPHALSPFPDMLPNTSDGGKTGLTWTIAALQALTRFIGSEGIAVILSYSLGNSKQNRWEIVEKAKGLFSKDRISWKLLKNIRIWRINGKKEQPNPMLLRDGLPKKADCKIYIKDSDREKIRQGYNQLVRTFETDGWHVLGCGILEVKL